MPYVPPSPAPTPGAIYWVQVPFWDKAESKGRPALIHRVGSGGIAVYPIYSNQRPGRLAVPAGPLTGLSHLSWLDPTLVLVRPGHVGRRMSATLRLAVSRGSLRRVA